MDKVPEQPDHRAPPPRWDLSHLYPGPESREFSVALKLHETEARRFEKKYKGKTAKLTGDQLGEAIAAFEKVSALEARIQSYLDLSAAADNGNSAWAADISDRLRKSSAHTLFFTREISDMREGDLFEKIASPKLAFYGPWIAKTRSFRDHMLSAEAEDYQHRMEPVTEAAWRRLFDQLILDLRFKVGGKELTEGETVNLIDNAPDPKVRREAFAELGRVLGENRKTFSLITNTLADLKALDDGWREYEKAEDSRHLDNQTDAETVDALVKAVRGGFARTAHRYYAWKAKKAGVARLHPADRNAPLEGQGRNYTWDEAKEIVLAAYEKLSPELAAIGRRFFDEGWIDAEPRPNKDSGGFSHPTVPDTHPYILMNFYGTASDVMTLAHELGHGIHQMLAAQQGHFKADTPLTLAETASVFGEALAFRELMAREEDEGARRSLLAKKIEDMLNTVVRQTGFYLFEQRLHAERREKGELPAERIAELWQDTQRETLGPAVNIEAEGAENLWMHIPHFIHTPFYVYAYAFGDCLVNALYDDYSRAEDKEDFVKKYTELLKTGGAKRPESAIAAFGIDTADPQFWKKGLSVIERHIDELVALDAKLAAKEKAAPAFNDAAAPANDDAPTPENEKPAASAVRPVKKPKGPQP
jgi:oligoendopeptidase F